MREPRPVIPDQKERKRRWMQPLEGWRKWYCPVCQEQVDVKGHTKGQYYRRKHRQWRGPPHTTDRQQAWDLDAQTFADHTESQQDVGLV